MSHKIVYIPLDERPCNDEYPLRLFAGMDDIAVTAPPKTMLGHKKTPANVDSIRRFVLANIGDADALVASTEMLVYGGLLPSRIYPITGTTPDVEAYTRFIKQLKASIPGLRIYLSNLIMRTPRYNSSDEEPDYYGQYGESIFTMAWLQDKEKRQGLTSTEKVKLAGLTVQVPPEYVADYAGRRERNLAINLANIDLVAKGAIDYLVIPQDDSAEYGYTAHDQAIIYPAIKKKRLQTKIAVYPGADESGYSLLARAVQTIRQHQLRVFPVYASSLGKLAIPLYEDRPLCITAESHILASGCQLVAAPQEADIILGVNTPGKQMIEAFDQLNRPAVTYDTFRNLRSFVTELAYYQKKKVPIAVADSAYANGGDLELLSLLDTTGLLPRLAAYRGWNTDGNTLGSAIATAVILHGSKTADKQKELWSCILDDGIYQPLVRKETTEEYLPTVGANYFDLGSQADQIAQLVSRQIVTQAQEYVPKMAEMQRDTQYKITFPWNRMFEIFVKSIA
ncbi:MAG: DUF4127 family protein [Schleiferilactobacillus perolens]|uniref:DUF4127 family protein n=1 Tax=Schleiferilactobacillus perolens TaxID=100468 RepID=UPI0039EA0FD7